MLLVVLSSIAVIVVVAIIVIIVEKGYFNGKKKKTRVCVIAGESGAGKTTLLLKLALKEDKFHHETRMSMEENILPLFNNGNNEEDNNRILLVDVPGQKRVRDLWKKYLPISVEKQQEKLNSKLGKSKSICFSDRIVFVVDSTSGHFDAKGIASYLYKMLSKNHVVKNNVPVLICCNKADEGSNGDSGQLCVSQKRIEAMLESEIGELIVSRSVTDMEEYDEEIRKDIKQAFSFSDNCIIKVSFFSCSVLNSNLDPIRDFIKN